MSPTIAFIIAAALMIISPVIDALRIRRSGLSDSYALTEAFNNLAGPRKYPSGYEDLLARQYFDGNDDDDDAYFNPNDAAELSVPLPLADREYGFYPADLALKQFEPALPDRQEYPYTYSGYDDRPFGPQKRTAYDPHRVVPTTDELRTLFGDVPVKRVVTRREPSAMRTKPSQTEHSAGELADKMRKLIEAAEQLTKEETDVVKAIKQEIPADGEETKIVEETVKPNGVKETKIEEIFNDSSASEPADVAAATVKVEKEETTTEDADNSDSDTEAEGASLEQAQSKSKRASSGVDTSVYIGELLQEVARLKDKVSKLELLRILEDEENDDLAEALKYSTLDQLGEQGGFVSNEYKDISKATETEKLIQLLSNELESSDRPDIRSRLTDYLEGEATPAVSSDSNQWLDGPAPYEGVVGESDSIPVDANKRSQADLSPLLPSAEEVLKAEVEAEEEEEEEKAKEEAEEEAEEAAEQKMMEEVAEEAAEEVEKEIEEEKEEGDKMGVLKQLLGGLSTEQLQELATELQYEEAETLEEESCRAVFELSQNCAFADVYGIPLDEEARSLCSRHQLCYTCGSALDLTVDNCDDGYQATVLNRCAGDKSCVRNAVLFLALMQKNHEFEPYSPTQCARPCVEDYITLGPAGA